MSEKKARDETGKFVKKAEKASNDAAPDQVLIPPKGRVKVAGAQRKFGTAGVDPDQTGAMAEQYPTKGLSQAEQMDRIQMMKLGLADGQGNTRFGKMKFSDADAYWLLRKEEAAKKAAFQAWFAERFDRMSPAQKAMARKLYPQFYQERIQTLDTNLETLRKLARLRIQGVSTKEDLALQFAAENGLLPMRELKNILHPEQGHGARDETRQFKRGLLNTNTRFFGGLQGNMSHSGQASLYEGHDVALSADWPLIGVPRGFSVDNVNGMIDNRSAQLGLGL